MGFLLLSGAAAAVSPGDAVSAPSPEGFVATLTAYNAVPGQTDGSPLITADGGPSNPEVVAARSQDLADELPFGTIIQITPPATTTPDCGYAAVAPLVGYRVIADVMNVKIKDHVDILFPTAAPILLPPNRTVNASVALGTCPGASIRVVGHIDLSNPNDLPKTQNQLRTMINGSSLALSR